MHSNLFHSPVWPVLYPNDLTARLNASLSPAADYLFSHQVNSGLSFGIFDTEYKYKNPASAATNGALYWDANDASTTGEKFLEQMDFPLVSIALSYDGSNPLDNDLLGPLMEILPAYGPIYGELLRLDKRDPASWKATGPKQVLMRNATATRIDYAGNGQRLMKHLAHFVMREAKKNGYRGIQIETIHDAVNKVWLAALPDEGMTGEIISDIPNVGDMEETVEGETRKPYALATQRVTKIYVTIEKSGSA